MYLADNLSNCIFKVEVSSGNITVVAGTGNGSFSGDGGPATAADLNWPFGVALDTSGNFYIADWINHRIRKVNVSTDIITTIAGNGASSFLGDGGAANSSNLYAPLAVEVDSDGNIYIADNENHRVRKVTISTGIITTLAGTGFGSYSGDGGEATSATLQHPSDVAVDSSGKRR